MRSVRRVILPVLALVASLGSASGWAEAPNAAVPTEQPCAPGARTLAEPGDILFPEVGNGGYESVHTDLRLRYEAKRNRFLPGTRAVLRLEATRCLSEFSLDFETKAKKLGKRGPQLSVDDVRVDGATARHRSARPTYPGNPNGPDDPDPRAHQQAQQDPVGGPDDNPLPPACSPTLAGHERRHAADGRTCPASKLVITPAEPIPAGTTFSVEVAYHGRPGLHAGADGWPDGWWADRRGAVTNTEPLGSQAWMPLNNHPSAKPTYDVWVRTQRGKTVASNGRRVGGRKHRPTKRFPQGSKTVHWRSTDPVASHLVLVLVGDYRRQSFRRHGVRYRLLQDKRIGRKQRRKNARRLDRLDNSTRFLRRFTGPFPFRTDGAAVTIRGVSDMEMQTMSVFSGGRLDVATLFHENMHQWWGDAVTQARFDMVWFKEGMATFAEHVRDARREAGSGIHSQRFLRALRRQFDQTYRAKSAFWRIAPSDPTPWHYFAGRSTYRRPGAMYVALHLILGHDRFKQVLRRMQREYAGATVTRDQWEEAFLATMPTEECRATLADFFTQWIDTAYPADGRTKPELTAPGVDGGGFPARCR